MRSVSYNAGTDRTVIANRYQALLDVMSTFGREYGSALFARVRYSGGYYYTYFFNPAGQDDVVLEIFGDMLNVWNINRTSGTYYVWGTTLTRIQ